MEFLKGNICNFQWNDIHLSGFWNTLSYCLFISTYKAHMNALTCIISLNPTAYLNLTTTLLIII